MKNLLNDYVYRNLRVYHNTLISEKTYKKLGKQNILDDLNNHNLNCEIIMINHYYDESPTIKSRRRKVKDRNVVISIKEER